MAQLFSPETDRRVRVRGVLALLGLLGLVALGLWHVRSDAWWQVGEPAPQPIAFAHSLHAGALDLDCRYCHTSVERGPAAGMPSAQTCLTCHAQVWDGAGLLEPLRTAVALDRPIEWTSVSRLPPHARFDHAAHLRGQVDCATCHGDVAAMRETVKAETLSMGWCIDCHKAVAKRGTPAAARLTDCSACHY